MKPFTLSGQADRSAALVEAGTALDEGALVCLPCGGTYRLVADLSNRPAVMRLFQAKHRTRRAPTLVFVSGLVMVRQLVDELDPVAEQLMEALWPGHLTVLVRPQLKLPRRLVKRMCTHRGKIGVRAPADEMARRLVTERDRPLLVSSANLESKSGAYSSAQVRKNFFGVVEIFFDIGDLSPTSPSTVVDVEDGRLEIVRAGSVDQGAIYEAIGPAS